VRITDFGLARLAQTSYASATGLLDGKVAYLAPEVLDGGSFGVQSDLFALGVVVWETFTGERLFRAETDEETRRRLRTLKAPPVSAAASGLPSELDEVLAHALEKSPRARHDTVAAFADALEAIARRHDLCATDAELGAHVQAAIGDDKRDALSRARVSAASGRPRVDFAFVETASLALGGGDGLDDAPTALHFVGRSTPTTAWRAPPPDDPPTLPPSDPPSPVAAAPAPRPTSWRGPALAAAIVAIAGGVAALRWAGRPPPPAAPTATAPTAAPPPPATPTPAATPTTAETAAPDDETIEPADPPARARGPLRAPAPKASNADPDSLPANPYRKKL
jgi:serine/threonine-protein kinase